MPVCVTHNSLYNKAASCAMVCSFAIQRAVRERQVATLGQPTLSGEALGDLPGLLSAMGEKEEDAHMCLLTTLLLSVPLTTQGRDISRMCHTYDTVNNEIAGSLNLFEVITCLRWL